MTNQAHCDDQALAELASEFPGHRIWRARRQDGAPGDWVATLHDAAAGVDPTVVGADPVELRARLVEDRERAARGVKLR